VFRRKDASSERTAEDRARAAAERAARRAARGEPPLPGDEERTAGPAPAPPAGRDEAQVEIAAASERENGPTPPATAPMPPAAEREEAPEPAAEPADTPAPPPAPAPPPIVRPPAWSAPPPAEPAAAAAPDPTPAAEPPPPTKVGPPTEVHDTLGDDAPGEPPPPTTVGRPTEVHDTLGESPPPTTVGLPTEVHDTLGDDEEADADEDAAVAAAAAPPARPARSFPAPLPPRPAGSEPLRPLPPRRSGRRRDSRRPGTIPTARSLASMSPPPRERPRWRRRVLALLALAMIGIALYLINAIFQPFHDEAEGAVAISIPAGADAGDIGEILAARGVVDSARFFAINATLTGRRGRLRPGEYTLPRAMSHGEAIEALMQGPKAKIVKTFKVTIPEGRTRREVASLLRDTAVRGDYVKATASSSARRRARRLGLPRAAKTAEGYFFPATYDLVGGATATDLATKQLAAYRDNVSEVSMRRARRRNLTRYDVLIIASMIEREAMLDKERPLIAAVIYNRLREGMPLAIDATTRYSTNNWTRPIRRSELEDASDPYNTRLNRGLPPTPIGNPGLASIKAAAAPSTKPYLFYVVKPGTCGEHAFSATDAQFAADRARYEAERAKRGGKSPTDC
jgi:uncharacterized YceG family protein